MFLEVGVEFRGKLVAGRWPRYTLSMTEKSIRRPRRIGVRGDTRKALIEGAFKLLDGNKSFDGLSQRELTRDVGIVPTAFYRHFPGMQELGLTLVDEAFRGLRQIIAEVRTDVRKSKGPVTAFAKSLLKHVRVKRDRFSFIVSERYGGNAAIRDAIRRELRLVQSELTIELARFPQLNEWPAEDLQMVASLMLNSMVAVAEEMLDRAAGDKHAEAELITLAERQLRLIVLGVAAWKPTS